MTDWWHHRQIDRYFAGRLGASRELRMRRRLERCPRCRAHYGRHLVAEAALPGGDQRAADRLWRGIRRAQAAGDMQVAGSPRSQVPLGRRRWWATPAGRAAMAGAVLGAAVVVIGVRGGYRPFSQPRTTAEPVARGATEAPAAEPSIHLFRSVSAHAAEPVGDKPIRAGDGLLFAYSNPDPALTHLMVFAIDQTYAVHWYYPAYLHPGENPEAVSIHAGPSKVELGEEIRHDLRPGALAVYVLFLRESHRVLEIETLIRHVVEEPARSITTAVHLPVPGSVQSSILLEVEP